MNQPEGKAPTLKLFYYFQLVSFTYKFGFVSLFSQCNLLQLFQLVFPSGSRGNPLILSSFFIKFQTPPPTLFMNFLNFQYLIILHSSFRHPSLLRRTELLDVPQPKTMNKMKYFKLIISLMSNQLCCKYVNNKLNKLFTFNGKLFVETRKN